jgi:hypothetical protein
MTPPEMDEDDSAYVGGEGNGLLAWIVGTLTLALVVGFAYVIVTIDTKDEQRIDAERQYQRIKDMPVPVRTVVVTTPGPTVTVTAKPKLQAIGHNLEISAEK